jgi:AcrR family transcriptional regulator
LILALDQHPELLARGGRMSDLVAVRRTEHAVCIAAGEAKFTTGPASPGGPAVVQARQQIQATLQRLQRLTLDHPLKLRVRAALARAIVSRAHLASPRGSQAERITALIESVLEPPVPIQIEAPEASVILVWSLDASTRDEESLADGPRVRVHGREATLSAIRSLGEHTAALETDQPAGAP